MDRTICREEIRKFDKDSKVCYVVSTEYAVHNVQYLVSWTVSVQTDGSHSGFVGSFKFDAGAVAETPEMLWVPKTLGASKEASEVLEEVSEEASEEVVEEASEEAIETAVGARPTCPSIAVTWRLKAIKEQPLIYCCTSALAIKPKRSSQSSQSSQPSQSSQSSQLATFTLLEPEHFKKHAGRTILIEDGGFSSPWIKAAQLDRGIGIAIRQTYIDVEGPEDFPKQVSVATDEAFGVTWLGGRFVNVIMEKYAYKEYRAGMIGGEFVAVFQRLRGKEKK